MGNETQAGNLPERRPPAAYLWGGDIMSLRNGALHEKLTTTLNHLRASGDEAVPTPLGAWSGDSLSPRDWALHEKLTTTRRISTTTNESGE